MSTTTAANYVHAIDAQAQAVLILAEGRPVSVWYRAIKY